VQVRHDEGVAIRIGPEPCVVMREGGAEASVGECIGQPLSRESRVPSADMIVIADGNTDGRVSASARTARRWSETLACADAPCAGTGRSRVQPGPSISRRNGGFDRADAIHTRGQSQIVMMVFNFARTSWASAGRTPAPA
jgi:hypothetical protein